MNPVLGVTFLKPEGWIYIEDEQWQEEVHKQIWRFEEYEGIDLRDPSARPVVAVAAAEPDESNLQPSFSLYRADHSLLDEPAEAYQAANLEVAAELMLFDLS